MTWPSRHRLRRFATCSHSSPPRRRRAGARMTLLEHDEGRPGEERPHNVTAGDIQSIAPAADAESERCRVCGHQITSEQSIAAGVGTDCRRDLRAALRSAELDVLAAYAIALGAA